MKRNLDFERIFKTCNPHLTETKSAPYINSRGEYVEKISLTQEEEEELWYDEEPGDPEAFIEYQSFTWQRRKSNECVTDTRRGKGGFSFYYAIHVFDDPYSLTIPDEKHLHQDNGTRVNSIGIAPELDKTLVVTNANLDDSGKIRIISASLADETNMSKFFNLYWKNRQIKERFSKPSKLTENMNKASYFVLRRAKGQRLDQNSFAKVVPASEVTSSIYGYTYKNTPVFIQNFGTKEWCEKVQHGIQFGLNHFGIGEDW